MLWRHIKTQRKPFLAFAVLALSAAFALGCNTVEGAGEDIENLGEGVSDATDGDG